MYRPKYPIYIPSKGRAAVCYTAKFFLADGVDFKIVVEPSQVQEYEKHYPKNLLLVLPEDGLKLLGSRLWIREYAIAAGHDRHWQFDDNIRAIHRLNRGRIIRCNANIAITALEDFTDRFSNIGVSGFNYEMFVTRITKHPYTVNTKVFSASLINNRMPYKWRLYYNDDTDLCLQVVHNKLCTVQFNAFVIQKIQTMLVKGGNTDDLYKADGRLSMARTLEAVWPQYVEVKWRFGRPQHFVKNNWQNFSHKLILRKDLDMEAVKAKRWEIELKKVDEIKSDRLRAFYKENAPPEKT